jgi:hypothetical protein
VLDTAPVGGHRRGVLARLVQHEIRSPVVADFFQHREHRGRAQPAEELTVDHPLSLLG